MILFKNKYRIESTRLRGWDYRTSGYYFGQIIQGEMHLSSMGEIAAQCWRETPKHHANVDLDEFMIMPNHTHGIVVICNPVGIKNVRNFTEGRFIRRHYPFLQIRGYKVMWVAGIHRICLADALSRSSYSQ